MFWRKGIVIHRRVNDHRICQARRHLWKSLQVFTKATVYKQHVRFTLKGTIIIAWPEELKNLD